MSEAYDPTSYPPVDIIAMERDAQPEARRSRRIVAGVAALCLTLCCGATGKLIWDKRGVGDEPSNSQPGSDNSLNLYSDKPFARVVVSYAELDGSDDISKREKAEIKADLEEAIRYVDEASDGRIIQSDVPVVSGKSLDLGTTVGHIAESCDPQSKISQKIMEAVKQKAPPREGDLTIVAVDRPDSLQCGSQGDRLGGVEGIYLQEGEIVFYNPRRTVEIAIHEANHKVYGHDNGFECPGEAFARIIRQHCKVLEYLNTATIAGHGNLTDRYKKDPDPFSAFEQEILGMIDTSQIYEVKPGKNVVTLQALADKNDGTKIIAIPLTEPFVLMSPDGSYALMSGDVVYVELSSDAPDKKGKRPLTLKAYVHNKHKASSPRNTHLLELSEQGANGLLATEAGKEIPLAVGDTTFSILLGSMQQGKTPGTGSAEVTILLNAA